MKVGDKVRIKDNSSCDEAKVGETGKIIEFCYAINAWWEGEDKIDYRVEVELDRKKVEPIIVSPFLSNLKKVMPKIGQNR